MSEAYNIAEGVSGICRDVRVCCVVSDQQRCNGSTGVMNSCGLGEDRPPCTMRFAARNLRDGPK